MNLIINFSVLILLCFSAVAAEQPSLITTLGEHTLAEGLRLIVRDRGADPIEFTIARKFPDTTTTANSYSPLAAAGQPFVFCWVLDKRRLWVASPYASGYVDLSSLPSEAPQESSYHSNLIHHNSLVPAKLVAEMPANFRDAAAKWFSVAADPKHADKPAYPATQLFINNHRFGDTNGCGTTLGITGGSTCGHAGHVSEVAWTFLRRTAEGDVYRVTRKYPSDSATPGIETREVTYAGKPIVLWHDDYQKILLRPEPKA